MDEFPDDEPEVFEEDNVQATDEDGFLEPLNQEIQNQVGEPA